MSSPTSFHSGTEVMFESMRGQGLVSYLDAPHTINEVYLNSGERCG